ncbi:MAG TPA: ankyrin repeat domain-containing protein [Candidatus Ozemobacteraceae bacterium]|nr:ankyrin repeat domain-containing protein [Candidatus Ozemobacteraceae bacterium]
MKVLLKRILLLVVLACGICTGCWMTGSIHSAAKEGKVDVVKRWLALGGDLNEKDPRGATPLHCAIEGGHRDVIKLLLQKGADVHQINDIGNTPLHEACWRGQFDTVQALVATGANPLAKAVDGKTPTDLARAADHQEIVNYLLALPARKP